jgi:hypothetical protein
MAQSTIYTSTAQEFERLPVPEHNIIEESSAAHKPPLIRQCPRSAPKLNPLYRAVRRVKKVRTKEWEIALLNSLCLSRVGSPFMTEEGHADTDTTRGTNDSVSFPDAAFFPSHFFFSFLVGPSISTAQGPRFFAPQAHTHTAASKQPWRLERRPLCRTALFPAAAVQCHLLLTTHRNSLNSACVPQALMRHFSSCSTCTRLFPSWRSEAASATGRPWFFARLVSAGVACPVGLLDRAGKHGSVFEVTLILVGRLFSPPSSADDDTYSSASQSTSWGDPVSQVCFIPWARLFPLTAIPAFSKSCFVAAGLPTRNNVHQTRFRSHWQCWTGLGLCFDAKTWLRGQRRLVDSFRLSLS